MSPASEELADRIRAIVGHRVGVTEKKMFGGICFMLGGNMVVGSMKDGAMLMRVGPERHEAAKRRPGATPMIQAGREMAGFVLVADEGIADDEALEESIDYAWGFVKTLPAK
ncbi:MAG: TfoX/Sxy family protein [Devosia sp.]|nr:TfoX/Sxy family protein [Devosia sp.]